VEFQLIVRFPATGIRQPFCLRPIALSRERSIRNSGRAVEQWRGPETVPFCAFAGHSAGAGLRQGTNNAGASGWAHLIVSGADPAADPLE